MDELAIGTFWDQVNPYAARQFFKHLDVVPSSEKSAL